MSSLIFNGLWGGSVFWAAHSMVRLSCNLPLPTVFLILPDERLIVKSFFYVGFEVLINPTNDGLLPGAQIILEGVYLIPEATYALQYKGLAGMASSKTPIFRLIIFLDVPDVF